MILHLLRRVKELEDRVEGLECLLADEMERSAVPAVEMPQRDPDMFQLARQVQAEAQTPAPDGQY